MTAEEWETVADPLSPFRSGVEWARADGAASALAVPLIDAIGDRETSRIVPFVAESLETGEVAVIVTTPLLVRRPSRTRR